MRDVVLRDDRADLHGADGTIGSEAASGLHALDRHGAQERRAIKILVISNLYPPGFQGGYELGCAHVTRALTQAGHDVRVLTSGEVDGEPDVSRALKLFPIFDPAAIEGAALADRRVIATHAKLFDQANVSSLAAEVADFAPDVAYLWNLLGIGGLGLVGWLEARAIPWVWHLMDAVPRQLCALGEEPLPSAAEAFAATASGSYLACSTHVLGEIRRGGFELPGTVRLVPNWVGGELPAPRASFYSPGERELRITTAVGVLVEHKGIDILIDAAYRLRMATDEPFRVDIYGREDDDRFRALASERGLEDVVGFNGVVEQRELMRRLSSYDVFAFPTEWREPFAFAPLEAAAAGSVPLISGTCGNAEWMVDGVHCLKAARDRQAFANALKAILDGQLSLAPIARRAQAVVRSSFAFAAVYPRIEAALLEAIARRASAGSERLLAAAAAAAEMPLS